MSVQASEEPTNELLDGSSGRLHRTIGATVAFTHALPAATAVALLAAALGLGWGAAYFAGGAAYVAPHWFYIPILVAAARFSYRGAVISAIASGILAGPALLSDVELGVAQAPSDEIVRAVSFLVIGLLMAAIVDRLRVALERERHFAAAEREFEARKAAVLDAVSHEFRTPLAVILGTSLTLLRQEVPREVSRELVTSMHDAARRLDGLVAAVVTVTEGHMGQRAPTAVELRTLCQEVVARMPAADLSRLHLELGPGASAAYTSQQVLHAILGHLLDNAFKFSPDESTVVVDSRKVPAGIQIRVRDRGCGISPGFATRAFEAFTQESSGTTRQYGGLGLGLFLAYRLAGALGGTLSVEPRPGGGTDATLSLPRGLGVETKRSLRSA